MRATSRKLDPNRKSYSMEIFGYDFMIDEDMNVWLIEVNTNPCLELSSPYLARLIPAMIENALK
jgi:tubulin polyglutamylase TTLL1